MPQTLTSITIFLASPSDVNVERGVVTDSIDAWNVRHGRSSGVIFQLIKWETSVSAGYGDDGQQVINDQVNDEYDVLIALFWTRLGSATPRASSGTVEEYRRAWTRIKNGEAMDIAFFFKDAPIDPKHTDLAQLSLVNEFETEVQQAGALTKSFRDQEGLKLEIAMLLDRLAKKYNQPSLPVKGFDSSKGKVVAQREGRALIVADDDIGLFDIVEELNSHAEAGGAFLKKLAENLVEMTTVTSGVTQQFEEIKAVRTLDVEETKSGLTRVAESMNTFSSFAESDMTEYGESLNALANDVRNMIRVSYDWIGSDEDMLSSLWLFRQAVSQIHTGIVLSQSNLNEMVLIVSGLPRAMTRFNRSKRRLVNNIAGLIAVNENGRALIEQALAELGMLIVAVETRTSRN